MYTFAELQERYGDRPRKVDTYLRPLTHVDTGNSLPFPMTKLVIVTIIFIAICWALTAYTPLILHFTALVGSSIWMGVVIQIVRSASTAERNAALLKEAPLVFGRVVQGSPHLYQTSTEKGLAVVVFSRDSKNSKDAFYLKDVGKKLRAATPTAPDDAISQAKEMLTSMSGAAVRLPESVGADGDSWIATVAVNPERLESNKIVKQQMLLLAAPDDNLVVQL